MKKQNYKKPITITRRIDRQAAPIDPVIQAELINAPKLTYVPKDKATQNKLADELVAWCRLSDSLTINGYPLSKGYNPYRFFKVAQSNEYFSDQVGTAKALIIDRLENGLHAGKYDRSVFNMRLPLYDIEHRKREIENIKLSRPSEITNRAENFRIEIAPAESSNLVPFKDNNE